MSIDKIGGEVIEQKIGCFRNLSMLSMLSITTIFKNYIFKNYILNFLVFKIYIDFLK